MGKKTIESTDTKKWELRREDNVCTQIWRYDTSKSKFGPVSVETIWKKWILDEMQDRLDEEENKKFGKKKRNNKDE